MLINPCARELVAAADETLGYSLLDRFRNSESDFTEAARVAFLVNCLALARWAEEEYGARADAVVGPSFGGTPAAVHSGALSFADAVWLTARWGHGLEAYFAEEYGDVVTQSFARTPPERLATIRAELEEAGEWHEIACHVDDDFYMLSVRERRLEWLQQRVRALGGLPLYTMRPPMHSPAFGRLRERFERGLFAELSFTDPVVPVVSDHDGSVLRTGEQVRTLLLDGIVRPVHWPTALATLRGLGVSRLYVSGPDGLWGRVRCARRFDVVALKPKTALLPRRQAAVA
ncbi:ACP S-malonyltransferase [Streptomyces sp. NBC_00986]|uniref:ACP S-malonyltransferase n=1 Tax=Streptomyces sp. NBC_00986 TaxID=2903702 RepID=UPI003863D04A|nr:ACP S-malonyltransferase [Streptomyces sp. NBC_00986]WSX64547.1 ACP S-malonyltransferase [Streptomyces sp. NBC_00986]